MQGKMRHYFWGVHTARGFFSLYESNLQDVDEVVVIKGSLRVIKSKILETIAKENAAKGHEVECIHCASDNNALDGVIIPALKTAFTVNDLEHTGRTKVINSDTILNLSRLIEKDIRRMYVQNINRIIQKAHRSFKRGLEIHDGLEEIYINSMDFHKADKLTGYLVQEIIGKKQNPGKKGRTKHRFFGASTPRGVVDYIPDLTADVKKRYLIKGRAGTGKSTLLKKVARFSDEAGFDVEMYHCGFDPHSIDMVIIRELGVCLFDSTDPHEYFPEQEEDQIIDLYTETVMPETDQKYAVAISELTKLYKSYMKQGITYLKEAKTVNDQFERSILNEAENLNVKDIYDVCREVLEKQGES
ncbi:hypothetical protein [Salipaludibacillus aurantiacus]|uniref:Nucleotide kinase n=1 Tax=Salipaludibacillus aurantiacus TaxID=1601833 RepID=A0A1H9TG16_9BACI|nr:hypothetical protein [Salipaludibacillus aurantiacus]SER96046.1 hypothetical protein SAMN05518684_105315 [Salipaludibacillus aurantiacus]